MLYAFLALGGAGAIGWIWALWQRGSDKSQAVDLANARAQCAQLVGQLSDCRQKLRDQITMTSRTQANLDHVNEVLNETEKKLGEHLGPDAAHDWLAGLLAHGPGDKGNGSLPN